MAVLSYFQTKVKRKWPKNALFLATLPGRQVFEEAVIPKFFGTFDGNGHTISSLNPIKSAETKFPKNKKKSEKAIISLTLANQYGNLGKLGKGGKKPSNLP